MVSPEQRLWQSVIVQALEDALRPEELNRSMDSETNASQARSFFECATEGWSDYFTLCCAFAGYDPEYIKDGYEKAKCGGGHTALLNRLAKTKSPKYKSGKQPKRKQPPRNPHGDRYRGARY